MEKTIKNRIKTWLTDGNIACIITFMMEIFVEIGIVYVSTFFMAVNILQKVVISFGHYALEITGAESFAVMGIADQFAFFMLPCVFVMLILLIVIVIICIVIWIKMHKHMDLWRLAYRMKIRSRKNSKKGIA